MSRAFGSALLLMLALLLAAAPLRAQRCEVEYLDSRGKVRSDKGDAGAHTYKGLVFKRSGAGATERLITPEELVRVVYSRLPDGLEEADALRAKGDHLAAADAYLAVVAELKPNYEWARQECLWKASEGLYRIGDYERSREIADRLLSEVADTRYKPRIELRRARETYAFGELEEAASAFAAIATEGATLGYAKTWIVEARLGQVRALLDAEKTAAAEAALATAVNDAAGDESARRRVGVLQGRLALAKKDLAKAKQTFQGLLDEAGKLWEEAGDDVARRPHELIAGAANGLGDALFEEGSFEEAAKQFSKTFALCRDVPSAELELGWAYWRFALCSKRLANGAADDETRRTWTRRFTNYRERVAAMRMTRGGQLARKELGLGR